MRITRRQFMQSAASFAAASALPPIWFTPRMAKALEACEQGRNLVIIQLEGGNDGTNTVIPMSGGFRPIYDSLRPVLGIAPADLAPVVLGADPLDPSATLALHPHMTGLARLHGTGNLATLLGTHYEDGSLSHFTSERIWYTGQPDNPSSGDGWMGQALGHLCSGQLGAVPGLDIESELTPLFRGPGQVLAIRSLDDIKFPVINALDPQEELEYQAAFEIAYARSVADGTRFTDEFAAATLAGVDRIDAFQSVDLSLGRNLDDLLTGSSNGSGGFGADGPLFSRFVERLRLVFGVMMGGPPGTPLGPRVFRVGLGGFDTHSSQGRHLSLSDSSIAAKRANGFTGERHGELLHEVDQGIAAFWQDCVEAGISNDTMIMTFSEFGRRIGENTADNTAGTDHGTLAPMFVVGPSTSETTGTAVQGGLFGTYPDMNDLDGDGNYKFVASSSIDFRRMYGELMVRWLGIDVPTTESILNFPDSPIGFIS